ncbi:hypothetical protein CK203_002392 [Vitis vinifera]|uniref:Uncharacterized protein n=1 Tax=Vitis vinifera TaxID=29760 RepID=A0A438KIA9_VITVI|nr:hypothetical protein CK203_002392 [Vitis vinifera]
MSPKVSILLDFFMLDSSLVFPPCILDLLLAKDYKALKSPSVVYPAGQRLRPERMSIGYCHCFGIFTIQFWTIYTDRQSIRWDLKDSYGYSHYTCHDRIHKAGVIPSSLHQKVKFIHEGRIITIKSDRDIVTSFELVLQISHNEDDLHLIRFTFQEHNERHVLYAWLGIGSPPAGVARVAFTDDHDIPYGLGYTPSKEDLVDYFTRGLEHSPHIEGVDCVPETVEIQGIQQALGQMCLSFETIKPPEAIIVASPSLDRASVFSICFPKEILTMTCLWIGIWFRWCDSA